MIQTVTYAKENVVIYHSRLRSVLRGFHSFRVCVCRRAISSYTDISHAHFTYCSKHRKKSRTCVCSVVKGEALCGAYAVCHACFTVNTNNHGTPDRCFFSFLMMHAIYRHTHRRTDNRGHTHTHTPIHTVTRMRALTHTLTDTRTHTHAHARTRTHTHTRTRTHTHTHTHTHTVTRHKSAYSV